MEHHGFLADDDFFALVDVDAGGEKDCGSRLASRHLEPPIMMNLDEADKIELFFPRIASVFYKGTSIN